MNMGAGAGAEGREGTNPLISGTEMMKPRAECLSLQW